VRRWDVTIYIYIYYIHVSNLGARTLKDFLRIFGYGMWLTQEPPRRFKTICFHFPRLHGFRNLNFCRLRQMEQLLLAEAKQGLLFDISQIVSSIPSCQV